MKQMYLNRINAQERFENGPKTVRVKSRIGSRLVRKSLDSFLTRFCLISLFLILMGGFTTEVWAQLPYNKTMTQTHYNNSSIVVGKDDARYSHNGWDGGIKLEAGGVGSVFGKKFESGSEWNWDDKYVIIALKTNSIPYQLKFKYKCSSSIATEPNWYVAESTSKNGPWTNVWSTSSNNTSWSSEQTVNLSKSTKYIKLCYSGNYGGTYGSIKVTDQAYVHNPKVGDDEISSLDFGSGTISSGKAELSFDVEWCNVSALSVTSSNSTYFTVSPSSFGNTAQYSTQTVTVYYDRDVAVGNNHSGTITISNNNANYTKTVTVSGSTTKRPQAIHWNASLAAVNYTLNAEESLTGSAIATADKEDAVITYSSDNVSAIAVSPDGKTLMAIATGTANITATATGDDIYADGTDSKTFTVTAKKKQTITWNQNLMGLKTNASPNTVHLTATATSNGTITYAIEAGSDACITLSGANNSVMTITGTPGEAYIIATQAGGIIGGEEWISATARKQVKVRDPNSACDEYALADQSFTFNKGDKSSMYEKAFNLTGKPTTLTFYAKRGGLKYIWSEQQDMYVEQYANFGSGLEWQQVAAIKPGDKGGNFGPYTLNETATKIRFRSGEYAEQNVSNISIPRATILNVSETSITDDAERNVKWSKTISVTRSNIDVLDISVTSSDASCPFQLSKTSIGTDCADMNTETFEVFFTPTTKNKTYTGTITITDGKASNTHTATIPLSITTVAFNQAITWNFEDNQEFPTTNVPLELSASTDATGLSVSFKIKEGDEGLALLAGNTLTFTAAGTLHVIAYQEGNDRYNPAPEIEKTIIITRVTPDIATDPTVSEIKYLDNLTNGEGCQLSEGLATVTLRGVENTPVDGKFTWTTTKQVTDAPGNHTYSVTFTPTDGGMYNPVTFTQTVNVVQANGGISMKDGSVKVKVAGINDNLNECKIDLNSLIQSKKVDAGRAGAVSYVFKNTQNKSITGAEIDDNNVFSATAVGSYTIVATQAQTEYYEAASDEFTVTVNKLTPTIVFDNTDNPEIIYSGDVIETPAYRMYNGHEIDRAVSYVSSDPSITGAIHVDGTTLTARDVTAPEGSAVQVTITASTSDDALYNAASETATHNYSVRAKRSPVFTMEGVNNAPVSKTLNIGETAVITYNENVDANFTVGTAAELSYITFVHDSEHRTITVTAQKGTLIGDGEQTVTLNQPGNARLFERKITYPFTVKKNVSALSLAGLTTSMQVEDMVATPYTGLANTEAAVQFTCSPEGSMKMENGKLIALQAGTNTVTFSQPATEYWTGVSESKTITVSRKNPNVTTELSDRHAWYSIIEHPFKSLNTEKELQITSSNDNLAKYVDAEDKIYVYGTSGSVTFTVNQEANYKYNAVVNYQKTFEIFQPNNRLPMTLTSSNLSDYNGGSAGSVSWNDGGVVVGKTRTWDGPGGWDAKYITLKFVGVPDKLSFDFENTSSIATQYGWHFYQSSNGKDWSLIKEYADALTNASGGTSSGSERNLQLEPATQYVKLEYHGNYGGRFKNVNITERKEIVPQSASTDFGLGYNGNDPTARTIKVDWYNVQPCTVTIINDADGRFELAEGSNVINSLLDNYGTAELVVRYKHDVNTATQHTATLRIQSQDGKTADVALTGQTTPAPQTIIWRSDLTPMPIEGSFQNAAMVATGQSVTLVSDHPEIVRVVNNTTLEPVSAGTARVTATAAGSTKWAETTDDMDIEVTTLKVQYITWTDNLSNRKREEGQTVNITLTATSSAGLPITYELDGDAQAFASISGNVLSLTGWGNGQVIAKQVGNEEYVAVQASKSLVSRNPNAKCRPLVGEYKDEYTLHTLAVKEIPIYGEPDSVTFWAKCDWSALWGMWVAEEYNGSYHDIQEISRTGNPNITSDYQHYSFPLHRNATAVKLYTKTGATMTRTFKNVEIPLAKYLELAENTMNFSQVDKGSTKTQSFYINYSNLTGVLDVEMQNKTNTQFTVLTPTVGEDCGDAAKNARINIQFTGSTLGTENNTIIVSNKDQRLEIPVSATVVLPTQAITWNPALNIFTTDQVQLEATATSELEVTFTSNNSDIAEPYRRNDGTWWLNIHSYGNAEIVAHQPGDNESWGAATDKPLTFHISRVVPEVDTWPTAQITLPNTLAAATLTGGEAPDGILGSFSWEDESQTVTRQAHTFNVVFEPTNTDYYEPVSHPLEIEILKTPQTITWNRAAESEESCAATIILDATASSGLPITYTSSDETKAYIVDAVINEVPVKKLYVLKGGDVTITASQSGDDTYDVAPSVAKKITLIRVIPTIETLPTATDMYVHHFLSNSTPEGGDVKAGENTVTGVFNWQDGSEVMDVPGTNQRTVVFQPYNSDYYQTASAVIDVEVKRFAPTITSTTITTEPAVYGTPMSDIVYRGSVTAIDGTDPARPEITGTWTWKLDPTVRLGVDDTVTQMIFHPDHTEWYDDKEFDVNITITEYTDFTPTATATIIYGQTLSEAVFVSTTKNPLNQSLILDGEIRLGNTMDPDACYGEGEHTITIAMQVTSDANFSHDWKEGTATLTVLPGLIYNGTDGVWNDGNNWIGGVPDGDDRVTIDANVDVVGNVTVTALTINAGKTVTIKNGATLTVGANNSFQRDTYGDIHVEEGGKLVLTTGTVDVNNLYLDASLGNNSIPANSGQIRNPQQIDVNGDAYFDLRLDPVKCSYGWYDFTVPFPVDNRTGISRFQNGAWNTALKTEQHYAIMTYYEDIRANGQYGWKKYYGIMQPGKCYTITVDNTAPLYRFRKVNGADFNTSNTVALTATDGTGGVVNKGWNCIGNGTLTHTLISSAENYKVQIYDHANNSYGVLDDHANYEFPVGTAVFVQTNVSTNLVFTDVNTIVAEAPMRTQGRSLDEYLLSFSLENDATNVDRLYLSASEDAENVYEIGHDLAKFGTSTTVAQIWADAYGQKLCDVEAPLVDDQAIIPISLYAAQTGTYTLETVRGPQDASLYLMYNGAVIWNLSQSAYTLDLTRGTTTGYSLLLTAEAPSVTTGVDALQHDNNQAEKIILNGKLYILRDGQMYDATGKKVK